MTEPTRPGGGADWRERLYAVGTDREFRELLGRLQRSEGLTGDQVARKAAELGGLPLPKATVAATLSRDKLPKIEFVRQFIRVCGVQEDDRVLWTEVWQALEEGRAPLQPQDAVPAQPDLPAPQDTDAEGDAGWALPWLGRRRLLAGAGLVVASGVGGGLWWRSDRAAARRAAAERAAQDKARQEAVLKSQCGTDNPALRATSAWCSGITDGSDGHEVFGKGLKQALAAIDAENRAAVGSGVGYVTVALMGPLTTGDNSLTGDRAVHQVEGAFIAQHRANAKNTYPKIRLVLANMGSDETSWPTVVDQLKTMTGRRDRLVAVTGMGLSQQESIDAARSLAKASVPMVGDLITADGFDTTGRIDGGAKIDGLVRIASNTSAQVRAISRELGRYPGLKTAALVSAPNTPSGTPDFYTESLRASFENPEIGLLPYLKASGRIFFRFSARNDAVHTSQRTISNNLCGNVWPDMVFYAGRANRLPDFLEYLRERPCRANPITVVTGSDAATLDPGLPALNDKDAPISVLYVPLADPGQLAGSGNPDRGLFKDFADEFTRVHHGQRFDKSHLATGWAVMGHDALLTATLAIRNAIDPPQTPPSVHAVKDQLYLFAAPNAITGASGVFYIDPRTGNRISTHEPRVIRLGAPLRT